MNKLGLLALPALAILAFAGMASAFPMFDIEDMTEDEKDLRVQMLELKQEAIQNRIAYLNGEMTEEVLEESMQAQFEEMKTLREQMREMLGDGEGCDCGMNRGGMGFGHKGMGHGMMGGI